MSRSRTPEFLALAALVLAALYLRVHGLGQFMVSPDEAITLLISREESLSAVLRAGMAHPHPPLRYMLLHALQRVGDDPLFLKCIAYLPGVAIVPLFFLIGRRSSGWAAGLAMAAIGAYSYASILLSQVLRAYMLSLFFQVLGLWLFASYLDSRRARTAWLYSGAMLLGLCAHYSTMLVAAPIALAWLVRAHGDRRLREELPRLALAYAPIALVAALSYRLHISTRIEGATWEFLVEGWLAPQFPDSLAALLGNLRRLTKYLFFAPVKTPFLILQAAGLFVLWRRGRRELAAMALCVLLAACVLALLGLYPLGPTRQSLYLLPFAALTCGASVQALADALGRAWRRRGERAVRGALDRWAERVLRARALLLPLVLLAPAVYFAGCVDLRRYDHNAKGELPVRKAAFESALDLVARSKAADDIVLVDGQTGFYLTLLSRELPRERGHGMAEQRLDGQSYVHLEDAIWSRLSSAGPWFLDSEELLDRALAGAAALQTARPGTTQSIWLVSIGWGPTQRLLAKGAYDDLISHSVVDEDGGTRVYQLSASRLAERSGARAAHEE
jgi:hypothetical protein